MALDLTAHHAQALRRAVSTARQKLDEAHISYHAILMDFVEQRADLTTFRQEGEKLARAVVDYSDAIMEWLTYADKQAGGGAVRGTTSGEGT